MEPGDYYDVHFHDEWLDIDDFATIRADSEEEAEDKFWEDHDSDRVEVTEIEHAVTIPSL